MNAQKLKFKIDENLSIEVADVFKQYGYNAETVLSEGLQGSSDEVKDLIFPPGIHVSPKAKNLKFYRPRDRRV